MDTFISKFGSVIKGVIRGFDRIVFHGRIRGFLYSSAMEAYLYRSQIMKNTFKEHCIATTKIVRKCDEEVITEQGRPTRYLNNSNVRKDELARQIAADDSITSGTIAGLTCVELCQSPTLYYDKETGHLKIRIANRKCLHLYHYFIDDTFGFMSARIQMWYPFNIQVCMNGHEYLARQMDKHGIAYVRDKNCFTDISNIGKARQLFDQMKTFDWVKEMKRIRQFVHPAHDKIITDPHYDHYWTAFQTEWSTDFLFESESALNSIYPQLVTGAISAFNAQDVMRFLGRKQLQRAPQGDVTSSYASPYNGIRIKHTSQGNSVKAYNKSGSVLRIETTINNVTPFKSFHAPETNPNAEPQWRAMRKSVADMPRRVEIQDASNNRYAKALTTIDATDELGKTFASICQPVEYNGKHYRGLHPFSDDDTKLLTILSDESFSVNGFANRDVAKRIFGEVTEKTERSRNSSKISYRLRILKSHGIIKQKRNERRYSLTTNGRKIISQLLQLQHSTIQQLTALSA